MLLTVILYCLALLFNFWFFIIRPQKPMIERISVVLQIIGVYTFLFGILSKTEILAEFANLSQDMISHDIFKFISANFKAASLVFGAETLGFDVYRSSLPMTFPLEFLLLIFQGIFSVLFALFILIFVLPFSYLFYVCASVPVNAMLTATNDLLFSYGETSISIKEVVEANTTTIKNLLVAVPALTISLLIKIKQLNEAAFTRIRIKFRNLLFSVNIISKIVQKSLLIILTIFIVFYIFWTLMSFSMLPPINSNNIGEIIGVIIIEFLFLLILIFLFIKNYRKKNSSIKSEEL